VVIEALGEIQATRQWYEMNYSIAMQRRHTATLHVGAGMVKVHVIAAQRFSCPRDAGVRGLRISGRSTLRDCATSANDGRGIETALGLREKLPDFGDSAAIH
jgi:hypothetical protein